MSKRMRERDRIESVLLVVIYFRRNLDFESVVTLGNIDCLPTYLSLFRLIRSFRFYITINWNSPEFTMIESGISVWRKCWAAASRERSTIEKLTARLLVGVIISSGWSIFGLLLWVYCSPAALVLTYLHIWSFVSDDFVATDCCMLVFEKEVCWNKRVSRYVKIKRNIYAVRK